MAFIPPVLDLSFKVSGDEQIKKAFAYTVSNVRRMVVVEVERLAKLVIFEARNRVRVGKRNPWSSKPLADMIGARWTLGRTGAKSDEAVRIVVRGDIGARGDNKAKPYAMEMGQIGRVKTVQAHQRRMGKMGHRFARFHYTESSVVGSTIKSKRYVGMRTGGGIEVAAYQRRFSNRPLPYIGPAGEAVQPQIVESLTVALPRRLARMMAGET